MSCPIDAARYGGRTDLKVKRNWEEIKDSVMKKAVKAKILQHCDIKNILLSTGKRKIIEHNEFDKYWSDGGDGSGKNKLGEILMEIRDELLLNSCDIVNTIKQKSNTCCPHCKKMIYSFDKSLIK